MWRLRHVSYCTAELENEFRQCDTAFTLGSSWDCASVSGGQIFLLLAEQMSVSSEFCLFNTFLLVSLEHLSSGHH